MPPAYQYPSAGNEYMKSKSLLLHQIHMDVLNGYQSHSCIDLWALALGMSDSELPEFHKSLQHVHVHFVVCFLIIFTETWVIMESVGKTYGRKSSDSALSIALWIKIFAL